MNQTIDYSIESPVNQIMDQSMEFITGWQHVDQN